MRAAVVTSPDRPPAPAEFPEPEARPGQEPLHLVGAGLHHVVRGLAAGRHYESTNAYPLVPGVDAVARAADGRLVYTGDRKSTRLNSSHVKISYAVFCLKKKT